MGAFTESLAEHRKKYGMEQPKRPTPKPAPTAPRRTVAETGYSPGFRGTLEWIDDNVRVGAAGASSGFADRVAGHVNSWLTGRPYEEEFAEERAKTNAARRRISYKPQVFGTEVELAPAEIVGAIVSPINKLDKAAKGVRAAAAIGTRDAFLAGMGYSDSTDLGEMVTEGVEMAPYGLAGGVALGAAAAGVKKTYVKLRPSKATKAEVSPEPAPAPAEKPQAKPKGEAPEAAPARAPEPERGALVSAEELAQDAEMATRKGIQRIAKMSDEEVWEWAGRVAKAETDGTLLDDPHYRSILNVDVSDVIENPQRLVRAINALEDVHEALMDRLAATKQSTSSIKAKATKTVNKGVSDDQLDEMVSRSRQGVADGAVAGILMAKSGVEAVRSYDRFLSALKEGSEGARQTLQDELGRSVYIYAAARAVRSNQGRALQAGQIERKLGAEQMDKMWEMPSLEAMDRFKQAFSQLSLDDIKKHLSKLRSGEDIDHVLGPLMNPEHAYSISMWRRSVGTFEAFLKSTVLTPTTAVVNGVSNVLHDSFRNGLARRLAAARLAGRGEELAAVSMRLEHDAARAAYWQAHAQGLRAMLDRIKFDLWEGVESTVGVVSKKARDRASASRLALAARNNFEINPKDFNSMNPEARLRVNDLDALDQKVADLQASGAFGAVWARMHQAGAVTLNAVDFAGTITGKLFTGAVDDWGRTFVAFKEQHALAARSAVKEAIEAGLEPADFPAFVSKRVKEKVAIPDEEMWNSYESSVLRGQEPSADVSAWLEEREAIRLESRRVTFQDGPQTKLGQSAAAFFQSIDPPGVIFRFVRTPVRLLERGLVDYTPFGRLAEEGRKILAKGGPEAELYKAQMTIGTTALGLGATLAAAGIIRVTNGSWESAENLSGAPGMRLQIGDTYVEFGRLDPFATTIGLGALWGQAANEGFLDYDQYGDYEQAAQAGIATAAFGFRDVVLEKSYLKNLRDLLELVQGGQTTAAALLGSIFSGLIPLGGVQRQLNDTLSGHPAQAVTISDNLYRSLIGVGMGLPARRNALGDKVDGRMFGISAGQVEDDLDDVSKMLKEHRLEVRDVARTDPSGFRLSASQLNRFRYLRGHAATNSEGFTLREAVADLVQSDEFQLLRSLEARQELLNKTIRSFNAPARALLEEEDPDFAARRAANSIFEDYLKEGSALSEATAARDEALLDYLDN